MFFVVFCVTIRCFVFWTFTLLHLYLSLFTTLLCPLVGIGTMTIRVVSMLTCHLVTIIMGFVHVPSHYLAEGY